jgi:hypothetical protein
MPVPAAIDALSHHLRRTVVTVTGWIGKPRGAALSPSAAPLTPIPRRALVAGAACCSPCSVELPGEAA